MKYKLFVSDFDGTLAGRNGVSERNRQAIREYVRRGGIFTLCTGRNLASIKSRLPEVGLGFDDVPVMYLQGCCASYAGKPPMFCETLARGNALKVVDWIKSKGLYCHTYTAEEIYTDTPGEISEMYERLAGVKIVTVKNLHSFVAESDREFVKVLAVTAPENNDALCAAVNAEFGGKEMSVFTSSPVFTEAISINGGKGNGLRRLAGHLGIAVEDTIGIGDEMNDASLISAAGLGVAVGNAREGLKKIASYVSVDCDDGAIADVMEKYCF